jgi:two-component system LytT family response regulator
MRILVVDDEPLARIRLIRMLKRNSTVESVAEAENGRKALKQIELFHPNVLLLDIQMPGISGLEIARSLPPEISVIFTTAHDEHAIEAFELAAVDYLLKPIPQERLDQALERAQSSMPTDRDETLTAIYESLRSPQDEDAAPRITARKGDAIHVFDLTEIDRLSSAGGYTSFQRGDEEFLLDESLSALEERLKAFGFLRIHRSELIRIAAVRALHNEDGKTTVELEEGSRVHVSRRLVAELKTALGIN